MIRLKTMTMQLIDGKPDGIRICRVEGESLVTIIIPRDELPAAKQLPDIPPRGIYYLLDEDHGNLSRVYAGQTTRGVSRLDAHKAKKDFWNKAVMFLDTSVNIDRDVLDALEATAIEFITSHGSYETDNSDVPNPSISPYKEESVTRLHESILFRMQALGYDLDRMDVGPVGAQPLFHTSKNGVSAKGRFNKDNGRFTVYAGSQVNLDRAIVKNIGASKARCELFGTTSGMVELEDDLEFPSPSAAAVFVLGGSQNGWTEWKDDDGCTLDGVYRNAGSAPEVGE